eukprot:CAMPEP_0113933920 /NCGR_PEP_ID=MMETSP1339-20121228/1275_1 /TAXON_ID=94617 /ORGANISM="Fibrocapsa japonica" /LENGTH=174 /DNA_ID=CAMNT_0000935487 /DNA_START=115 /DNA_END=640 /DNA_ORIENTATION=+ /assembly_acc=CAM_ASM_000762
MAPKPIGYSPNSTGGEAIVAATATDVEAPAEAVESNSAVVVEQPTESTVFLAQGKRMRTRAKRSTDRTSPVRWLSVVALVAFICVALWASKIMFRKEHPVGFTSLDKAALLLQENPVMCEARDANNRYSRGAHDPVMGACADQNQVQVHLEAYRKMNPVAKVSRCQYIERPVIM